VIRTHPSLSPSLYYPSGSSDHHHLEPQYIQQSPPNSLNSPQPTPPQLYYKVSPSPYPPFKNQSPSPGYVTLKRAIGSTVSSLLHKASPSPPTPKSIYDKIHNNPNYAPVTRGQRAGPATNQYVDAQPSPYSASLYEGPRGNNGGHSEYQQEYAQVYHNPQSRAISTASPERLYQPHYSRPIILDHPPADSPPEKRTRPHRILKQVAYSPPPVGVNKSRLLPYPYFKAGPGVSEAQGIDHGPFEDGGPPHEAHEQHGSHEHSEPHYILQEVPHEETLPAHHPRLLIDSSLQTPQIPPVKSSLATFTSNLAYAGISTPKPPLYFKSKRVIPVGRPVRPSVGGLVYLETPATGPRPTALGIKEILARLPHDNLPRPKTTTHPYELGSKDYGSTVGYSPATEDSYRTIRTNFKPSQEIPPEYLPHNHPHHHREYLFGRGEKLV